MDTFLRELRFSLRRLTKSPGSSAAAVVAMALGIALVSAMYAVMDGILLEGLPFEESSRILHLERSDLEHGIPSMEVTQHDFEDWRRQQRSFEDLGAFHMGTANLSDDRLPERWDGAWMTPSVLALLRVEPALGRGFTAADAAPGAPAVALLGHRLWQKRYGGDPGVLGRTVRVNGEPHAIVGVMPEGFRFPIHQDVWLPLALETGELQRGEGRTLEVIGRLRDGITPEQAAADMALIAERLARQYPDTNDGVGAVVQPYLQEFLGTETPFLLKLMFAAVALVLLIACMNVANLLVGRASLRGRELAIRSALGSGRARAIAGVLAEALIVTVAGAVVGLALARLGLRLLDASLVSTNPPFWFEFELDASVLAFTLAAVVVAAFLAGLLPALQASRPDLAPLLQDATRGSTSFRLGRLSRTLVVLEVAFSCGLLLAAGLAVRSVVAAYSYDLRFDPGNLLTARLGLTETDYPDERQQLDFYERLLVELEGRAEVVSAAAGTVIPTETEIGAGFTRFERPGETYEDARDMPLARYVAVSPGYFDTLGVEILAGRGFDAADREGAARVALVNEDFARKEWPGESPIGRRVDLWMGEEEEEATPGAGEVEVVGVVPDLRFAEFDNADDQQGLYVPLAQAPPRFAWIVVKTRSDPLAVADPLRRAVLELDPDLPLYYVRSYDQVLSLTMFYPNLLGVFFGIFGLVAVILACVGLYGVMAFAVTQRTQEMGVRLALGAGARDLLALVLRQGLAQVVIGLVAGLALGVGLGQALAGFLYKIDSADPLTFALVPAVLTLVALLACLAPARRAAATDPIEALRYE